MAGEKYIGGQESQLGPNVVGGSSAPTKNSGLGSQHDFIRKLAMSDGIEADDVSAGSVSKRRGIEGGAAERFVFRDHESNKVIPAPSGETPRADTVNPPLQPQSALVDSKAAPSVAQRQVWQARGRMTVSVSYVKVEVPVTSVAFNAEGNAITILSPLAAKSRFEPPRGETVKVRFTPGLTRNTPLDDDEEITLYATGIYTDIPELHVRSALFFRE